MQTSLESNVSKRNKNNYGPPVGKKLVCFIDDMNMPQVDTYGTQQPIALLKLLFELGGMYDRTKELSWKYYVDICTSLTFLYQLSILYKKKKNYTFVFYRFLCSNG